MRESGLVRYMRAHGDTPGPTQRPGGAGAMTGALAGIPSGAVPVERGALRSVGAALGRRPGTVARLRPLLSLGAGICYRWGFGRGANDRGDGWLFGATYGYLLWPLGPVTFLRWTLGTPLGVGRPALGLLGLNLVYGVVLGAAYPFVHRTIQRRFRSELAPPRPGGRLRRGPWSRAAVVGRRPGVRPS
ncbi:MAG TPA: hypothetical protein VNK43_00110 [Gemmatimonadales bacterium]|nr:hypothetical protein [Gemmatimonadales bacterium]